MLSAAEELRFWTGIMRDHSEFMITSFSFEEQDAINLANFFKMTFSRLHELSKEFGTSSEIGALKPLINECTTALLNFINFKRVLLGKLLQCQLKTSLPPTFYNHMINEAMEFYKSLLRMQSSMPVNPLVENLALHKIWLPDAAGHAATIACKLDPVEKLLINEAHEFEKCFNFMVIKAEELCTMLIRTDLDDGVLKHFNDEVRKKIAEFICYLEKIGRLRLECKILSTLLPQIPYHMIREETYYMQKIPV